MTVYYLAPSARSPKGGIRTIYRHVDTLNRVGLAAAVVHSRRGFRCTWFANETRVVAPPLEVRADDVLVVPEAVSATGLARLCPGITKVIFNQNVYRTFASIPRSAEDTPPYSCPDVAGVLTVSKDSERYLRYSLPDMLVRRVRHHIDGAVFHPDASVRTPQIAVMPRRRLDDFDELRAIFALRGALRSWRLVLLQGMTESEVARTLQRSALFMSMSRKEGFGLPPAEAIACGCHVIGCHGQGGREFFVEPYAEAIEDGDVIGIAQAVEAFVATYDDRRAELDRIAGEGSQWILSEYSAEHQSADLVAGFDDILARRVEVRRAVARSSHVNWSGCFPVPGARRPRFGVSDAASCGERLSRSYAASPHETSRAASPAIASSAASGFVITAESSSPASRMSANP